MAEIGSVIDNKYEIFERNRSWWDVDCVFGYG